MSVLLVGSNPGLLLHHAGTDGTGGAGGVSAFAAVWRVAWSRHGAGDAVVLWHAGRTRVLTDRPPLGAWLAQAFTRHFPEVEGLAWPEPELTRTAVAIDLDLASGMVAQADDVRVEVTGPLDRRPVRVAAFPGNGWQLSNVYTPCRDGVLHLAGRRVPGAPHVVTGPRASSSAYLADAEVWCD